MAMDLFAMSRRPLGGWLMNALVRALALMEGRCRAPGAESFRPAADGGAEFGR